MSTMTVQLRSIPDTEAMAAGALPDPADARDLPGKPVTIVVPFGSGTANDIVARQLAQDMTATLGERLSGWGKVK